MTKIIIGVDRADRSWLTKGISKRIDSKGVAYNVASLGLLIATIAIIFAISASVSAKANDGQASQESTVCAATDNLMSEEMAEYIEQHPGTYDEQDMQ